MKVAMVKHKPTGKVFWFGVPDRLVGQLSAGAKVACDTSRGRRYGVIVGSVVDEYDVKEVMVASGATYPLRYITGTTCKVPMQDIKIPAYMVRTKPSDEKIAKRFLEVYHDGAFDTNIVVNQFGVLVDGYSAYLVAEQLGYDYLVAFKEG